jgi:mono/diheme cytochrome c family protein
MLCTRDTIAACAIACLAFAAQPALAQSKSTQARGDYLARIMDCTGCHTPGTLMGKPDQARYLAGGDVGFQIPGLGYFWPPNLTPDKETGLGAWSEADIVRAVRTGVRPDGRMLAPAMPWHSYAALTDKDARDLARYLKSMAPVRNAVPPLAGPDATPSAPYLTVVMPKK